MVDDLVRARVNGVEMNLGRTFAESTEGVEVLDEPVTNPDGSLRGQTRAAGRPAKPRTTVAEKAAAKKTAASKTAAVTEPATTTKGTSN